MLELRALQGSDIPLVEVWLHNEHVKRWYEIPHLGVTIDDWISEIKQRDEKFQWISHFIVLWKCQPIGLCQYYKCADSDGEDFGTLPLPHSYGIDYLIGEESFLGKGLGKKTIAMLVCKIFSLHDALRITADIDVNNKASERALLSCGFTLLDEGSSRYVISRELFEKSNSLCYDSCTEAIKGSSMRSLHK